MKARRQETLKHTLTNFKMAEIKICQNVPKVSGKMKIFMDVQFVENVCVQNNGMLKSV